LKLYKNQPNRPKKLVLIGHSIGGKIAQSLLTLETTRSQINTVIVLASPMDKPVLALDSEMYYYYQNVNNFWMENRHHIVIPSNRTNNCIKKDEEFEGNSKKLDEKLLITVGGGSRDLMVSSGLTDSKFSNVHVLTESIPVSF
jgi:glycosylphosphatidylinositol deacylase